MRPKDPQWKLFDGEAPEPPAPIPAQAPETYSVSSFNERVGGFLKGLFPGKFRIQGFVSGFARSWARGSHVYFDLVEKDPEEESRALSQASLVIWRGQRNGLRRDLERLGGSDCELDDLQVTLEVSMNFYVPRGRLSLVVEGVDVEASLGAQKLDRERILRQLAAEGLVAANRARPLPAVPLCLALITSLESAAYHDFVKELDHAGLAFRLGCIDARVQGSEQEAEMAAAFAAVDRRAEDFDAVVLIRGGGSRSDLAGFDTEPLARAIAACRLPVITGIGHEIDRSIADEMAHQALKTPTAVAQFLIQRVETWLAAMEEQARRVGRAAEGIQRFQARRLDTDAHALRAVAGRRLGRARERLGGPAARLPVLLRQFLRLKRLALRHQAGRISSARLAGTTGRAGRRLEDLTRELGRRWRNRLRRERAELEHFASTLRLVDPRQVLKRGFSLSRDASGRLLRDTVGLKPGAMITTQLAAGELESELRAVKPGGKEGEHP